MSELREITAKSPKLGRNTTVLVNVGATVEKSIEMFGGDAVNSNANAAWCVTLQASIRRAHLAGKDDETIQKEMDTAKMGVAMSGGRVDPIQASLIKYRTMNAEEREAFIEQLKAAADQIDES